MGNIARCFRVFHLIIIILINDSECKSPAEVVRSFHSSTSLWQNNRLKRFEMKMDGDSKITIDSSKYPLARKDDSIVDDFHGIKVGKDFLGSNNFFDIKFLKIVSANGRRILIYGTSCYFY